MTRYRRQTTVETTVSTDERDAALLNIWKGSITLEGEIHEWRKYMAWESTLTREQRKLTLYMGPGSFKAQKTPQEKQALLRAFGITLMWQQLDAHFRAVGGEYRIISTPIEPIVPAGYDEFRKKQLEDSIRSQVMEDMAQELKRDKATKGSWLVVCQWVQQRLVQIYAQSSTINHLVAATATRPKSVVTTIPV